jgi:hypothetical protein
MPPIDWILVPQGSEYQTVQRSLRKVKDFSPRLLPIPIGGTGLKDFLHQWVESETYLYTNPQNILLLGLGGSLSPKYNIGDIVIFSECLDESGGVKSFSPELTRALQGDLPLGRALTCDRLLTQASEKQALGQAYAADVVEMEGFSVLSSLQPLGVQVAMLRVISDTSRQDLPNLSPAITPAGTLAPLPLAWQLLQSPQKSLHLIRGSLQALHRLGTLVEKKF